MREETMSSGYDQPQTDPIPALDDESEASPVTSGRASAPGPAAPGSTAAPGQVPPQAEPIEHPDTATTQPPGSAGVPPADPGPNPVHRLEPEARESHVDHAAEDSGAVLFGDDVVERFRLRWREVQADFVDDPARAVQGADGLVDEVLRALTEVFAAHKRDLEDQWRGGGTGETEELRVALRSYRSFFDRLLNT